MEPLTNKSNLERLPVELKMMIMQKLTKQDLCNVALVSKNLNSVALDPSLWTQITITTFPTIPGRQIKKMIHSPRFKKIKLLKIVKNGKKGSNSKQICAILKEAINVKSLVELDLGKTKLLGVPAELLSKTISNLKKVDLSKTKLSTEQLVAVCEETIKSNSLIELILKGNNLEDVPPKLLSTTVSKLQKADVMKTNLSTVQAVAILEETIKSNSIIELNIGQNGLHDVPTKVFSKAISKLEKANLSMSYLSTEQVVAIFEETTKSNSSVKLDIDCSNMNFKDVPSGVLSKGISKLEKADLRESHISTEQIVAIFEEIIKSNSSIELDIDCRDFNFKDVPAGVLSKGISKLKVADLFFESEDLEEEDLDSTYLSTEQLVAILEETIKSNSLTELSLRGSTLDDVPAKVLSKAKVKHIDLGETYLSTEQVVAILEETIKSNSLISLDLECTNLGDVPAGVLSKAISKQKVAHLVYTNLSTEQIVAILEETITSKSLTELRLDDNNFEHVPPQLLRKAISKLKKTSNLECVSYMEKALADLVQKKTREDNGEALSKELKYQERKKERHLLLEKLKDYLHKK